MLEVECISTMLRVTHFFLIRFRSSLDSSHQFKFGCAVQVPLQSQFSLSILKLHTAKATFRRYLEEGNDYLAIKPFFIAYASTIILQVYDWFFVWHVHSYTCVAILCLQHDLGIINKGWDVKKGDRHTLSFSIIAKRAKIHHIFNLISSGCACLYSSETQQYLPFYFIRKRMFWIYLAVETWQMEHTCLPVLCLRHELGIINKGWDVKEGDRLSVSNTGKCSENHSCS